MNTQPLLAAMVRWCGRDARRTQHFVKVWGFARAIGQSEGLEGHGQFVLESAALTHDIGIKLAEAKYGSCAGPYQEELGPAAARPMLEKLGYDPADVDRICWLIGHHHTYGLEAGLDYQILLEADFLVNAFEDGLEEKAVRTARERVFRTRLGTELLDEMFLLEPETDPQP